MAVKQKVVECVAQSAESRLQLIIRTLQEFATEQGLQDKVCKDIVRTLGTVNVPTDPSIYMKFIEDIRRVKEILVKECMKDHLILVTLKALYKEISTCDKTPSPAMSIVLELIDVTSIQRDVSTILDLRHSSDNLKRALMTLCIWLTKWTWTENLGPLALYFMIGLDSQHYQDIVSEVTVATIEQLFKLLILIDHRNSVGPIVLYMLQRPKNNPEAFRRIIPHINNVINNLYKENSESSLSYLQAIVEACVDLMDRFPEYSNLYVHLKQELQPYLVSANSKQTLNKLMLEEGSSLTSVLSNNGKVGLNNLGNTCYMNSVLQSLFMTKSFRNGILFYFKNEMTPLYTKLQSLFALLQFSNRLSLSPNDISNLARPPGFLPGYQHDSSEFLGYLLDILHEQEKTAGKTVPSHSVEDGASSSSATPTNTIVQSIFGGRTLSISKCGKCHRKSERVDNFRELQLSFPNTSDNQSVQTLLDYYLQPEKLSGDNQYHCDVCTSLTDGERVTTIEEAPPRLILTLKHFRYDPTSQQRTKLLQSVKLDNHVELATTQYELYAAVVHCGSSVDSGHYYTFARDGADWFKFNDCSVTRTNADELCSLKPLETPYILFYSRQDNLDPEALSLNHLSQRLQLLILKDHAEFEQEKSRRPLRSYTSQSRNDEPPPPGCGGSGFSANSSNMYVC